MVGRQLKWFGFIAVLLIAAAAEAEHWPGWRGDGNGVTEQQHLPLEWGPQHNIRWKTPIEGEGISSPVVWDRRVFVSSAIIAGDAALAHDVTAGICTALAGLALLIVLGRLLRRGAAEPSASTDRRGRIARVVDRTVIILAALLVATLIVIVYFARDCLPESGLWLKISLVLGDEERAWLITGGVVMLGLTAAAGQARPDSPWRLVSAAGLLTAAVLFYVLAPLSEYNSPIHPQKMLFNMGCMVAAAAYFVAAFVMARRSSSITAAPRPARFGTVAAAAMLLSTGLTFAYFNYLQAPAGAARSIVCIDQDTGRIIWQRTAFWAPAERKHSWSSYATPTPVTNGRYVVASFGPGMACTDMDGNVIWIKRQPHYSNYLRYGASTSPIIVDDKVICAFFPEAPQVGIVDRDDTYQQMGYLIAYSLPTGDEAWRVQPPNAFDAYASPLVIGDGQRALVILPTDMHAIAYEADTGREVWRCRVPIEQIVPSPVTDGKRLYMVGGTHGLSNAVAVRLGGEGDVTDTHTEWVTDGRLPECPSPVVYDGRLYWSTDDGVAVCVDAASGKLIWSHRLGGQHLASPIAGDGKVYFTSTRGRTTVVRAGDRFEPLATNDMDDKFTASPAVANGCLLLRGRHHLYCIAAPPTPVARR